MLRSVELIQNLCQNRKLLYTLIYLKDSKPQILCSSMTMASLTIGIPSSCRKIYWSGQASRLNSSADDASKLYEHKFTRFMIFNLAIELEQGHNQLLHIFLLLHVIIT